MSQALLAISGCKCNCPEPIALIWHDAVLTRERCSTNEGTALLSTPLFLYQNKKNTSENQMDSGYTDEGKFFFISTLLYDYNA